MGEIKRVHFQERDQQWEVVVEYENGPALGEPFPAYGGDNFSKLEQVLWRLQVLGMVPVRQLYSKPKERIYVFEVRQK